MMTPFIFDGKKLVKSKQKKIVPTAIGTKQCDILSQTPIEVYHTNL